MSRVPGWSPGARTGYSVKSELEPALEPRPSPPGAPFVLLAETGVHGPARELAV